jgi:hypothetical protein
LKFSAHFSFFWQSFCLLFDSFTVEKKLEIVTYAKSVSINVAAKKYNVTRSTIRRWKKEEDELKKMW